VAKAKKWAVLAVAPDQLTAEMWQDILRKQGVKAMVNPADAVSFMGVSPFPCRIMVAPADLKRAKEILASLRVEEEK
jgi:hypothetical protein